MSGYNISPSFCLNAPDAFLNKADHFNHLQTPENLVVGSIYDDLSKAIWEKFLEIKQSKETFCAKMKLWKRLNELIKLNFPRHGLFVSGSTLSGFATKNGDVDMSLIIKDVQKSDRKMAIASLENVLSCIKKDDNIDEIELIKPTVPILMFHDKVSDLRVDLNYNNTINLRNTHLLYFYSQIDWRVRPLVLIVKLWATIQDINNARYKTISSYSLILMVIHFLQCGIKPAVLPCLQSMFVDKFRIYRDIQDLNFFEDLKITTKEMPFLNVQTLGELFVEFLKYYDSFEFNQYVISVRLGRKVPLTEFRQQIAYTSEPYRWKCLCIEEPYTMTNTARAVHDQAKFSRIKQVFSKSYQILKNNYNLSSVLVKIN